MSITIEPNASRRVTLRTLEQMARRGEPFACLAAYDATMARWLDRNAGRIRVNHVEGELSSPVRPVPVPGRVAVPAARRLAS